MCVFFLHTNYLSVNIYASINNNTTVKPVINSTILSSHPLLSSQLGPLITVILTSNKQSPQSITQ